MQPVSSFRLLIVFALFTLAYALYISFTVVPPAYLDGPIQQAGYGPQVPTFFSQFVYYSGMTLDVIALLLCFFLVRYAHIILLVSLFSSPLQAAFSGIWISSPLEDIFWAIHWVCYVFIVGMAVYEPTISKRLRAKGARTKVTA